MTRGKDRKWHQRPATAFFVGLGLAMVVSCLALLAGLVSPPGLRSPAPPPATFAEAAGSSPPDFRVESEAIWAWDEADLSRRGAGGRRRVELLVLVHASASPADRLRMAAAERTWLAASPEVPSLHYVFAICEDDPHLRGAPLPSAALVLPCSGGAAMSKAVAAFHHLARHFDARVVVKTGVDCALHLPCLLRNARGAFYTPRPPNGDFTRLPLVKEMQSPVVEIVQLPAGNRTQTLASNSTQPAGGAASAPRRDAAVPGCPSFALGNWSGADGQPVPVPDSDKAYLKDTGKKTYLPFPQGPTSVWSGDVARFLGHFGYEAPLWHEGWQREDAALGAFTTGVDLCRLQLACPHYSGLDAAGIERHYPLVASDSYWSVVLPPAVEGEEVDGFQALPDGRLAAHQLAAVAAATLGDCAKRCAHTELCSAFAYRHEASATSAGPSCLLFTAAPGRPLPHFTVYAKAQ